jgi:hypothetical protein
MSFLNNKHTNKNNKNNSLFFFKYLENVGQIVEELPSIGESPSGNDRLVQYSKKGLKVNNNFRKNMNKRVLPEAKVVWPWYSVSIQWDSPTSTYLAFV